MPVSAPCEILCCCALQQNTLQGTTTKNFATGQLEALRGKAAGRVSWPVLQMPAMTCVATDLNYKLVKSHMLRNQFYCVAYKMLDSGWLLY
jgi:hypothetical protein